MANTLEDAIAEAIFEYLNGEGGDGAPYSFNEDEASLTISVDGVVDCRAIARFAMGGDAPPLTTTEIPSAEFPSTKKVDWRDHVVGAYYGCEVCPVVDGAIEPDNIHWWNGSGWVKGRLPRHLWGDHKKCRRRYRYGYGQEV